MELESFLQIEMFTALALLKEEVCEVQQIIEFVIAKTKPKNSYKRLRLFYIILQNSNPPTFTCFGHCCGNPQGGSSCIAFVACFIF